MVRRDALREELKAREYIRQTLMIAKRLTPDASNAFAQEDIGRNKIRADIYFRLLDKCLPSLRPVDITNVKPITGTTLTDKGNTIIDSVISGEISTSESETLMRILIMQAKVTETDELDKRVENIEERLNVN